MNSTRLGLCAAVAGCLLSGAGQAAIVTYTDRAAWLAAIGGATGGENFNGFLADADFDGSSVALSDGMTIGTLAPAGEINIIRSLPIAAITIDNIDGTPYAIVTPAGPPPGVFPYISFAGGIAAFGADFVDLNDDIERTAVQLFDGAILLATLQPPVDVAFGLRFWGFAATAGEQITRIRFLNVGGLDAFGMDNIEIATAVDVPEPETLVLLGLGLAGIGLQLRRRVRLPSTND